MRCPRVRAAERNGADNYCATRNGSRLVVNTWWWDGRTAVRSFLFSFLGYATAGRKWWPQPTTFPPAQFRWTEILFHHQNFFVKNIFLFCKTKAFVMPVVMFSLLLLIVPRAKRRDKFWGTGGRGLLWRGRNLIHHHHFFFVSARPRAGKKEEARELTWQLFRHRLLHRTPSSWGI